MTYLINEIFHSIQGEGYWTGRPAVFVRFSRCNLWTGREHDRHRAVCQFCDTDFAHADPYTLSELVDAVVAAWPGDAYSGHMVILTGGEPTLQADSALTWELQRRKFYIAIETNGTRPIPSGVDWVCVSPKAGARMAVTKGDELKVVYPQPDLDMEPLPWLMFKHLWVSPMDGPRLAENTTAAVEYVTHHPAWRLSVQTHKMIGVR